MLASLELENFKSFGHRTKIPLAPITLIFGENSAGKSSVVHPINLLKQTRESRDSDAYLLPKTESGIMDFGSFQDVLHNHDLSRELRIKFNMLLKDDTPTSKEMRRWLGRLGVVEIGIELGFARPSLDDEVSLKELLISLGEKDLPICKLLVIDDPKFAIPSDEFERKENSVRSSHQVTHFATCAWLTHDDMLWKPMYETALNQREKIRESISEDASKLEELDYAREIEPDLAEEAAEDVSVRKSLIRQFDEARQFYQRDFTYDQYKERMIQAQEETIICLDGFVPFKWLRKSGQMLPEETVLLRSRVLKPFEMSLQLGKLTILAGELLDLNLRSFFPLGPFRRPPQRWHASSGRSAQDVGYNGEMLPDFLYGNKLLVADANTWLEKLQIGYRIVVRDIDKSKTHLYEVRLQDLERDSKVEVAISEVGFGISQILPLIVQSLGSRKRIIAVEQPEVHIHPRLQADLGDLFAECIGEGFGHQFIIETHSEHLVLRLQKLVREGNLEKDDVCILYVLRDHEGSTVRKLELDEEGDFMSDWPGGFFPERLNEIRKTS